MIGSQHSGNNQKSNKQRGDTETAGKQTGPLAGYRVLDLSRILAGPWAGQCLADFGAEVIKVERPGQGDDTRHWGPPYLSDEQGNATDQSAYYLAANRGKYSVAIDLQTNEGQRLIRELAAQCDVLLENFKVGALAKYGLDYASLCDTHPHLVYCSITGFGQTGPYAERAGYDALIQAMGGLMSITGEADGEPAKTGVAVADLMTGMYAVSGVLAALLQREKTGRGQHIDLALFDTQVAWLANQAMNYLLTGMAPGRLGSAHPNIVPYQAMPTADGWMMLAVGNDRQFQQFCKVAGDAALATNPRFARNADRVAHRDRLLPQLQQLTQRQATDWWLSQLAAVGVPCGPINDLAAVFADPQLQARQMVRPLAHPQAGSVPTVANPVRFSEACNGSDRAPPLLGADTQAVLREYANLSESQLTALRAAGVIDFPD